MSERVDEKNDELYLISTIFHEYVHYFSLITLSNVSYYRESGKEKEKEQKKKSKGLSADYQSKMWSSISDKIYL